VAHLTTMDIDAQARLTSWFATQLIGADDVRIEGLEVANFGHSAETLLFSMAWRADDGDHREEVVLRTRPAGNGLLPPYDLRRQFEILRGLEDTSVRAPRALWFEPTGEVLGRDFYVMERIDGAVFEQRVPKEIANDPARIRRMTEAIVEQIAAIHLVDLQATGLDAIANGHDYRDREMQRWTGELRRLQRGPTPALEALLEAVRDQQPEPCPRVTLVHGDPKPGNFGFVGDEIAAVYDWELASIGDPLADIGWAELLWAAPVGLPSLPGALTIDEFIERYEHLTGISVQHREWYRAFQMLKTAVIMLSGSMLFDSGESNDLRLAAMGPVVHWYTQKALVELGLDPNIESGPVMPRQERIDAVKSAVSSPDVNGI
jgi:aminoglycoside phosphotransferase (APT) family kinase protein